MMPLVTVYDIIISLLNIRKLSNWFCRKVPKLPIFSKNPKRKANLEPDFYVYNGSKGGNVER